MSEPMSMTGEMDTQTASDRRGEDRQATCTRCELWVFESAGKPLRVADVVTRNSSFCGLAMVARLGVPLRIGQPMEVRLDSHEKGLTHFAGTVAFCKQMKEDYYEVGLHVKAAGPNRILTDGPEAGQANYAWFMEALGVVSPG